MAASRRLRLAAQAERDFHGILRWTAEHFGDRQSLDYRGTLLAALGELQNESDPLGVRERSDIFSGLKFYHVSRRGRPGRHFIIFRIADVKGEPIVEVLRILHDSMDFKQHVRDPKCSD